MTCSGDTDHGATALTTEQFAGEQIISIIPLSALGVFLGFSSFLHGVEHLLADDRRHTALFANAGVFVYANIGLVAQ